MKSFIIKITGYILTTILIFSAVSLIENSQATADESGYWAQADRYNRFPCAGPAVDCYVLPPIIITPGEN